MSDFKYVNSKGTTFDLCRRPLWVASFNALRSYGWAPVTESDMLFGFEARRNVEKSLVFQYKGSNREAFLWFKEQLYKAFAEDAESNTPGKFYIGEYFLNGFVTGEAVETYDKRHNLWISTVPVLVPKELWIAEVGSYIFTDGEIQHETSTPGFGPVIIEPDQEVGSGIGGEPFRWGYYPFGYSVPGTSQAIRNDAAQPSPFRLTIYGACQTPTITMGGTIYSVDVTLEANDRLIIDSRSGTVVKIDGNGTETNCLQFRNDDIFTKLPTGEFTVVYDDIQKFILTVFDERKAPKWI